MSLRSKVEKEMDKELEEKAKSYIRRKLERIKQLEKEIASREEELERLEEDVDEVDGGNYEKVLAESQAISTSSTGHYWTSSYDYTYYNNPYNNRYFGNTSTQIVGPTLTLTA